MTIEELKRYTESNEPNEILRDEVGRWIERKWILHTSTIIETYKYKYSVDLLLSNKDITKYRDSFAILSSEIKEVTNG